MSARRKSTRASAESSLISIVHPRAAGIDVGDRGHYVAVPPECVPPEQVVRRFGSFTDDLRTIADWLVACGITTVALESTGIYWIPLFEVLEARGLEVCLVDTRRLKTVPGRKTDVCDAQWLQQLHTYGLLPSAFRPEGEVCQLRAYLRLRATYIELAALHIQHMQKALQQMNVKLSNVVSDITGVTGMAILRSILAGERNPETLAKLRDRRCQNDEQTIARSLEGNWRPEHLFALRQAVDLYDVYKRKIVECDEQIEACLKEFPAVPKREYPEGELPPGVPETGQRKKLSKARRNAPQYDARYLLQRMLGVDLTTINGLDSNSVLKIVGEIGTDISRWPTVEHFTSWLGLCPPNKISGDKRQRSPKFRMASRAAQAFRVAAQSLEKSKSALGAFYRRMRSRRGGAHAVTATAHKLARICYSLLKHGHHYVDLGQEAYERHYQAIRLKHLERAANEMGFTLTSRSA